MNQYVCVKIPGYRIKLTYSETYISLSHSDGNKMFHLPYKILNEHIKQKVYIN